jgi:hypothetical protein
LLDEPVPLRLVLAPALLGARALPVVAEDDMSVPYELPGVATVVRAFRFDAPDAAAADIERAAAPFRRRDGSYRFENRFRALAAEWPTAAGRA